MIGEIKKLKDLVAQKGEEDTVNLDGIRVTVKALKRLMEEGYENLRVYKENKTLSLWGKNCTGCFTEEMLSERA